MILYYSATGNSQYVAMRLGAGTGEQLVSMAACCANDAYSFTLAEGEAVGIVSPTYYWGLPPLVEHFLRQMTLETMRQPYIYFVATYGSSTGQISWFARQLLAQKDLVLQACYSVKMPDTWPPIFDLRDQAKVARINQKAEPQIDAIIAKIQHGAQGNDMKGRIPMAAVKLYRLTYEKARQTKHLWVEAYCIGCGLCAEQCPVQAIAIQAERPMWLVDKCEMCLGCLHKCPTFSIQYGKKTKKHGQYQHPGIKP